MSEENKPLAGSEDVKKPKELVGGEKKENTARGRGNSVLDAVFDEVSQKKEEEKAVKKIVEKKTNKKNLKSRKKKTAKHVAVGNVYIQATYNNTIVTFADQNGNVIGSSSAGRCGFKGPKKSTPYAAGIIVKDVVERLKETGFKDAYVFVKGVGLGREAAVRALNAQGINVVSIKDITPIPHNGCRSKKPRRV